jgi:hypothetical protein
MKNQCKLNIEKQFIRFSAGASSSIGGVYPISPKVVHTPFRSLFWIILNVTTVKDLGSSWFFNLKYDWDWVSSLFNFWVSSNPFQISRSLEYFSDNSYKTRWKSRFLPFSKFLKYKYLINKSEIKNTNTHLKSQFVIHDYLRWNFAK